MKFLTVIIFALSITGLCNSAVILSTSDTINVEQGAVIVLTCRYNTSVVDRSKVMWYFVDHQTHISQGTNLLVQEAEKYSISEPQDENNKLNLQIKNAQATDKGHYKCSANEESVVYVVNVNTERVPIVQIPSANFTDCCVQQNVSSSCLPACVPSTTDMNTFNPLVSCANDLNALLKCFSDGRDHVGCCHRRRLPGICMDFCLDNRPQLTTDHLVCVNKTKLIISCFEEGQVHLPTFPVEVSALPRQSSILVNWKEPKENPDKVIGYRVFYKYSEASVYSSSPLLNATRYQYTIKGLASGKRMTVYVIAVSLRGSSAPSTMINTATLVQMATTEVDKDISDCCARKKVNSFCQGVLCRASTLTRYNPDHIFDCYPYLNSVFTCLAGERNHTECCRRNRIDDGCMGLCGGQGPTLDKSFTRCVSSLPTIEACVQEGLEKIPSPPTQLRVKDITWNSATLEWNPPAKKNSVEDYFIQYREQNSTAKYMMEITSGTYLGITGLKDNTLYECQVISKGANGESLPSESAIFLTYTKPEDNSPTSTPATAVVHDLPACCAEKMGNKVRCSKACNYSMTIQQYFTSDFSLIGECSAHFDDMLGCFSDGRDHSACCTAGGVTGGCLKICNYTTHSTKFSMDIIVCLNYLNTIQSCFKEGVVNLPKHPENLTVIGTTRNTIKISWSRPKTGPVVTQYIVQYDSDNMNMTLVTVNQTEYILQNLQPNTPYTLSVSSLYNNSQSPDSETITAMTDIPTQSILPPLQVNGTDVSGKTIWLNRTDCCKNSGIRAECQPVCLNQPVSGTQCDDIADKALACASDGRNHEACCERRNVPSTCSPLCRGQSLGESFQMASCLTYTTVITTCFIDNTNLLPGQPQNFTYVQMLENGQNKVVISWRPAANCQTSCYYNVHYWLDSDVERKVTTKQRVSSPYTLRSLSSHGSKYQITVTATNNYGEGQPSPSQMVIVVNPGVPDISIAQSPDQLLNQGENVQLVCDVVSASVKWTFNTKQLSADRSLVLRNIQESDSGVYRCEATAGSDTVSVPYFLPIRFKPRVTHPRADAVEPDRYQSTELICDFAGFPLLQKLVWTKDGEKIDQFDSHISSVTVVHRSKGLTEAKLKINDVTTADYGVYHCSGTNQYGTGTGVIQLTNPDSVPQITPGKPQKNITGCCVKENVSQECMDICDLNTDVAVIASDTSRMGCLQFLSKFTKCGADGRDHTTCCIKKGINPYCLPFCSGSVPAPSTSGDIFECVNDGIDINTCAREGQDGIPKAPTNVSAVFNGGKIVIKWSEPEENSHLVKNFKISYKTSNSKTVSSVSVSATMREYAITDLSGQSSYNIWIEAVNDFGKSQPSPNMTVTTEDLIGPPQNFNAKMTAEQDVLFTWSAPAVKKSVDYTYLVTYNVKSSEITHTRETATLKLLITDLDPDTNYEAIVQAILSDVKGQPSEKVSFKSGGRSRARRNRGGANGTTIGIGVGVVLLVLLVACIFIFIVIKRKRAVSSERVSFQNPNYEDGKIQISGLEEENEQKNFNYVPLRDDGDNSARPLYDESAATLKVDSTEHSAAMNGTSVI